MKVTTPDELARAMGKFRGNVDYSDAPNGFFGFVRELFEQLAKEEEYAADYDGIDIPNYPSFGHKDDSYDDVVRSFYAAWAGFASAKSFAWLDVYRLSDAPDRYTRRLADKENKKHRDDGRREFNDAVRALVAFVRKRDPRYTPNRQSDEDKAKAQRDARKVQAARARAAQIAKLEEEIQPVPSWATERPPDEEEESEEEIEEEHFECVACNKTFKSERQYEAHEKSKKHQKALKDLKRKMQKDNAHLDLDNYATSSGVITPMVDDGFDNVEAADDFEGVDDFEATDDFEAVDEFEAVSDSVDGITLKAEKLEIDDANTDAEDEVQTDADKDNANATPAATAKSPPSDSASDDEYTSRSDVEARLSTLTSAPSPEPSPPSPAGPKMGKAAQKRAKKAAKQAEADSPSNAPTCLGCDAIFASKSQLHDHLKQHPKHAALKTVTGKVAAGGKKGKKRG
jgi:DnaJ family protein A protein 5